MVLDSVQTIGTAEADGSPGGVTQVREVTAALVRVAKRRGMAVIIVGHVTKDGGDRRASASGAPGRRRAGLRG